MISICAHKIGGPVNSGALIVRNDVGLDAVDARRRSRARSARRHRRRRGGVGLAAAVRITRRTSSSRGQRPGPRPTRTNSCGALSCCPAAQVTGRGRLRVPGTVHVTFEGLASDELLFLLDQEGVCASAASSCSSGAAESESRPGRDGHVARERARGSLRLSMGAETTDDDVDAVIAILSTRGLPPAPARRNVAVGLADWDDESPRSDEWWRRFVGGRGPA